MRIFWFKNHRPLENFDLFVSTLPFCCVCQCVETLKGAVKISATTELSLYFEGNTDPALITKGIQGGLGHPVYPP